MLLTRRGPLRIYSASQNRTRLANIVTQKVETTAPDHKGAESLRAPHGATAAVVLADGSVFWGRGVGAAGEAVGEVCFNTSITGYQEIMTDPSYAGQIITFTFPHIGNVGTNPEDIETITPAARGCILRADITEPANWRATQHLDAWLKSMDLPGISGVDTRRLTRKIRDGGAPTGVIVHAPDGDFDIPALVEKAKAWPGLEGMDLAKEVTCHQTYHWSETTWTIEDGYGALENPKYNVVAIDYGIKRNILRCLASAGCNVTVVPATASTDEILSHEPDGIFLSNGPGDPAATGVYAEPVLRDLIETGKPVFGICLGHQLLARALGCTTVKMHQGHRGGNQPVKDLTTGRVEITSQNHGFAVDAKNLPKGVVETHVSLFDGSNEGVRLEGHPVFSVQYHPEASPGPTDSHYLFKRFTDLMDEAK
ncbi:MAG: glutamine-hydrolyzing carbamoyl-phosphate synthase small subunit [Rhodospirillales bacterium]|nr:glutamine-hydrolyzing carbamoyl-phosphate synthase small subunit [Rhodospirillales bacterium]MBO6788254.1 glutamine-hydrolyzing carbamoyl-phosphate synthase small subunit [Rhodospirillales bacterium]